MKLTPDVLFAQGESYVGRHGPEMRVSHTPGMAKKRLYLREWRKFKKLTQEEVAERLETTGPTISRWERGEMNQTVESLMQYAEAIGVEPDDLFRDPNAVDYQAWRIIQGLKPADRERALRILETLSDDPGTRRKTA